MWRRMRMPAPGVHAACYEERLARPRRRLWHTAPVLSRSFRVSRLSRRLAAALLPMAFAAAPAASATDLPRWEVGISTVGLYTPDYRGADEMRARGFVLPYVVYRGDVLRADREGLRARLLQGASVEFNVSAGLGLPVNSDRNEARRGMPEIDWVVEFGPAMNVKLMTWDGGRNDLVLRLPVRAAFALDGGADYIGAVFGPNLRASWRDVPALAGSTLRLSTGPLFATGDFHRFYYGVEPQFATATRRAYRPQAGYSGWEFGANVVRVSGDWRVFAFSGVDLIRGAEFDDSPLIRRRSNWSVGFGVAYVLARSGERVAGSDQ